MNTLTLPLTFFGEDFTAEVEYRATYQGANGTQWDPPEGPEWDVLGIFLLRDDPASPPFEATGMLFEHLAEHFAGQIAEDISKRSLQDFWGEGPDYYD